MDEKRQKEIAEERLTSWANNGKACEGCIFAYGDTPFNNAPNKGAVRCINTRKQSQIVYLWRVRLVSIVERNRGAI